MQIVIDIPEAIIKDAKNSPNYYPSYLFGTIWKAVAKGTVLPKGHGKLKDFDKIEWYGCDLEGIGCIEAKGDCSACNHANCFAEQVRELPTIIEADKETTDETGD